MRKTIIAGNWKMNMNHLEGRELAEGVVREVGSPGGVDVAVCPTFTSLSAVAEAVYGTPVALGAQNMHWEQSGAFTGEISADMLLTLGCEYVILGHSERRAYFHETDEIVARKIRAALGAGLTPIVCVGESLEQREGGITQKVVETQVRAAFDGLSDAVFSGTVIAYEPIWAIGTGKTATAEQAQEVHAFIRGIVGEMFSAGVADATRIQYGGSMKPGNAGELLSRPDIDGGLIGGASLKPDSFAGIVRAAH